MKAYTGALILHPFMALRFSFIEYILATASAKIYYLWFFNKHVTYRKGITASIHVLGLKGSFFQYN